ncbi:hypothetical protein PtA15_17A179 [Puccinia triticina]|uniref:Uncharacterized protein n=1 Tax=Puccinia triticina TaxID=208348 RepID=A0ABY7DCL4_9BASI|nr:uncharacterized protein PtA15_17A179 [Puccinia triticina]WAQ92697.1 hypothetical protein PtA15_17A179 [Puccinia triticina]
MSNSMQQATAFVKQLAGLQQQREEGTEDPAATPKEEADEVREGLLMDLGQPQGKGATNPEEKTDNTSNIRAQNKRGWP